MNKKKAFKIAAASAVAASAFVAAAPGNSFAASKAVVKSVSAINPITVTVGGKVSLPTYVHTTFSDKSIHKSPVKWNTKSLNLKKAGTYTLVGTVNGTSLKASVKVIVKAAAKPAPVKAVAKEVYAVSDINVEKGKQPSLPTYVRVLYTDGSVHHVPVTWDTTSLDVNTAGTYTATGTVRGTDIPVYVDVVVKDAAQPAPTPAPDKTAPVITLNGDATVNVAYGTAYTDAGATAKDDKDGSVAVASVITDAAGNAVASIDGDTAGTYTVTYTAVDAAGNKASATRTVVVAPQAAPAVTSVSAVNGNQVVVKFSRPVDPTTVFATGSTSTLASGVISFSKLTQDDGTTPSNTVSVTSGSLSADGTTLTVSADSLENFLGNYAVTVAGVKTTDAQAVPTYVTTLDVNDKTAPTLVSATASAKTSTRTITLNFSEPVSSTGAVAYINGASAQLSAGSNSNQLTLTSATDIAAGTTVNVSLLNVKDAAGNVLATNPTSTSVTVVADTAAPTVSNVTVTGEKTFKVTFSKKVSETASNFVNNVGVVTSGLNGTTTAFTVVPNSLSADGQTLSFTTSSNIFTTADTFSGTLVIGKAVTDVSGNALGSDYTQAISFNKDVTLPSVTKVAADSTNKKILFTFSKNVSLVGTSAQTLADVTLINSNGSVVSLDGGATASIVNNNQLVIDNNGVALPAGNYTVRLAAGAVTDGLAANNQNAATNQSLTVTAATVADTTAPTVTIAAGNPVGYNGTTTAPSAEQVLSYTVQDAGKGLDINSVLNVANYTIDGKALPTGSYITTSNYSASNPTTLVTVQIHIPSSSVTTSTTASKLIISNIADLAGNTITPAVSGTFALAEGVSPKFTSAAIGSNNTSLVLGFSTAVQGVDKNDFQVNIGGVNIAPVSSVATSLTENYKYVLTATETKVKGVSGAPDTIFVDVNGDGVYTPGTDALIAQGTGIVTAPGTQAVDFTTVPSLTVKLVQDAVTPVQDLQGNNGTFNNTITVK